MSPIGAHHRERNLDLVRLSGLRNRDWRFTPNYTQYVDLHGSQQHREPCYA
jgi:hypothetical protein